MAMFEVIVTREVTMSITVPAKDEDAARDKATEYCDSHIEFMAVEGNNPKPAREWEHIETGDSIVVEVHDA